MYVEDHFVLPVYLPSETFLHVVRNLQGLLTERTNSPSVVISKLDFFTELNPLHGDDKMTSIDYGPSSQTLTFLDPEIDGSL